MSSVLWLDALYRWAYFGCVYTGLRAGFGQLRHCLFSGRSSAARLHGASFKVGGSGTMRVLVHRRPQPRTARATACFGMISLHHERPAMNRGLYRCLRLTSHFGCGHVEAAFYELGEQITIYAFRDSARANAQRLGWRAIAQRLGSERNDVEILRALVAELERAGLSVSLASAAECVELALNRRLVPPRSLQRTCVALETRYGRLAEALAMTPKGVDPRPTIPLPIRGA